MIGRYKEIEKVKLLLKSERSEFLAVTGRRRVGKTYLIDALMLDYYCFSMTGIQNGSTKTQLINFSIKLSEYDGTSNPKIPDNWQLAFQQLKAYLKTLNKGKKHVIFVDELPWVATPKSGFIQMLAHFWNDYLSKEPHFILVICGSATSWITKKIINDAGGLHNRVTENIHLYPFSLAETAIFIKSKGLQFSVQEIAKIYMALGGIPFYLENIKKGESFAAAIERLCFSPTGILHNEYNNLYQALFTNAEVHQQIVEALALRHLGSNHTEILQNMGLKQPTGSYQRAFEELILSDFVIENVSFGKKKRGSLHRLTDEFSIFYHRFIKPNRKYTAGMWQQLAESQTYKIWSGFAFETLCLKHIEAIKKALGISSVFTEIYSLNIPATSNAEGLQIDLIIDRKDSCINLCEIKFYNGTFLITKDYYHKLLEKRQRFIDFTGTKKQVFLTFITNHGVVSNEYSREIVDAEVLLEQLLVE
ncbi:MAG: AAA family ATPase [Saprospiraceae bacterium]|nr:AAA family ATPase [Saprospiraceae bacterium]